VKKERRKDFNESSSQI
jgi:cellulose synthase/poly-beta-1,6-N-acetylglucosamine synthase-like glycosyltransferase